MSALANDNAAPVADLPLFQDARPMLGEPGVRDLYGVYVYNWDLLLQGRAGRLLDAAPDPAGLTDFQLGMAVSAFFRLHVSPGARHQSHRRYLNRVNAEQAARAARAEAA